MGHTLRTTGTPSTVSQPGVRPHMVSWLFRRDGVRPGGRWLRRCAFLILAIGGLATLRYQVLALSAPWIYNAKDFKQEYLIARAVLDGRNPYVLQATLAERYLPAAEPYVLPHPVPHPPFVAVLLAPLGLFSYETASAIWLGLELLLLLATVYLIAATRETRFSPVQVLAVFCMLLIWSPVEGELAAGQLGLVLLALLVGCWVAFKGGRPRLAGVLLGAAIAIKLIPVVVFGYFLVKRRWRVVLWAAGTFGTSGVVATIVLGIDGIWAYLWEGLPAGAAWRAGEGNYSAVSAVWRVFAGSVDIAPIIDLPWVAGPLSLLTALGIMAVAGRAVARARDPDAEFALALCAMVLVSPVAWHYYLVLLIWPMWIIVRRLHVNGWAVGPTNLFLGALLMQSVPPGQVAVAALWFSAGFLSADPAGAPLPAVVGLPFVALAMGPGLLFLMLLRALQAAEPARQQGAVASC